MKKLISVAVIALIMTSTANAQQDSTKPHMQHRPPMGIKGRDGKEGKDLLTVKVNLSKAKNVLHNTYS